MSGGARPGTLCVENSERRIDDGTSCRRESPRPGSIGLLDAVESRWTSTWSKSVGEWSSAAGNWFDRTTETAGGHSKSVILTMVDLLPFKQASPFSTALLKHYVERSGKPYTLEDIPTEWQDWIVKTTRARPGKHRDVNPYDSGLYDLRNSLGHFDVEVRANKDGTKTYLISDTYQFGAMKNDRAQRGRHGFPLGELTPWQIATLKRLAPEDEYKNPGGFTERWDIKTVGKETILFIPQQYLAQQGKPFKVTGSFIR